jgi:hypothetical protein
MIRGLTPTDFRRYLDAGDPLMAYLGDPRAAGYQSERWLADSAPKRFCAWTAYEPLLRTSGLRLLDVGAGYSSLSWALAERHDYTVAELQPAPDGIASIGDWTTADIDWDLVLTVDVFPNVDQRLAAFVRRFRGRIRALLTAYPERVYAARRLDGDEVLTVLAPDWAAMTSALQQWAPEPASFFPNGRRVCLATA